MCIPNYIVYLEVFLTRLPNIRILTRRLNNKNHCSDIRFSIGGRKKGKQTLYFLPYWIKIFFLRQLLKNRRMSCKCRILFGSHFKTGFSIVICQSKTLFLAMFGPRSSIIRSNFDCRLSGVSVIPSDTCEMTKSQFHGHHS